jgi:hypothetical protein
MQAPVLEYVLLIYRSWRRAISGPVSGIAAIVCAVASGSMPSDRPLSAQITNDAGWALGSLSVAMIFVSHYKVWREERSERYCLLLISSDRVERRQMSRIRGGISATGLLGAWRTEILSVTRGSEGSGS